MPAQCTTKRLEFEGCGRRLRASAVVPPPHRREGIPWERGRPARNLIPADSLPSRAPPLGMRAKPAFTGFLSVLPGLMRARRPRSRVGLSSRVVLPPSGECSEKSVQCTRSPMEYRRTGNWHEVGLPGWSRPHLYCCKKPPIQGHSLARRTKLAFVGFSSMYSITAQRCALSRT